MIVQDVLARGHTATALVRSAEKARPLLPGAALVEGDARDEAAVMRALDGCEAVISAIGTRKISLVREVTVHSDATRAVVAAMTRRAIRRLVCITGLGAGDSAGHGGFVYDRLIKPVLLRKIYQDKDRQEAAVRASSLDWVIGRPAVLNDEPARGNVRALTDLTGVHGGAIARADVARFVVDQLTTDTWLRRTPLILW